MATARSAETSKNRSPRQGLVRKAETTRDSYNFDLDIFSHHARFSEKPPLNNTADVSDYTTLNGKKVDER
jgi:hypothetical protein